jgi:cytoskeletal protein CcmA (bactofilin family)
MFGRDTKPGSRIDILIGKTARIQGDIDFSGGLHLDGRVSGSVRAQPGSGSALSVSGEGCIEGSVDVPNVMLNGMVKGDIRAEERVVLGAHAVVQGDVHYGVIETALGAQIQGRLVPVAPSARAEAAEAAPGEAQAPP